MGFTNSDELVKQRQDIEDTIHDANQEIKNNSTDIPHQFIVHHYNNVNESEDKAIKNLFHLIDNL